MEWLIALIILIFGVLPLLRDSDDRTNHSWIFVGAG